MREFGWATEVERPQVVALWRRAFGDSEAWVSRFWDICFAPERILVLRQRGKLAAMASIFETDWLCGGRQTRLWYLYAVATQPEQSGQGLATALLEQAAVLAMQRGAEGLLLVPGETSLQAFYRARGYRPWGAGRSGSFSNRTPPIRRIRLCGSMQKPMERCGSGICGSVPYRAWGRLSACSADDCSQYRRRAAAASNCRHTGLRSGHSGRADCLCAGAAGATDALGAGGGTDCGAVSGAVLSDLHAWNRPILWNAAHLEAGLESDGLSGIGAGLICPFHRKISCFFLAVTLFYLCIEAGKPGDPF